MMLFCLCQETWAANLTLNKKYLWYTGIIKTQRDKFFKTDNTLLTISVVQFLFLRSEKISMKQVEAKDIVTMTYTGRLDDGTVFKTAQAEKPIFLMRKMILFLNSQINTNSLLKYIHTTVIK